MERESADLVLQGLSALQEGHMDSYAATHEAFQASLLTTRAGRISSSAERHDNNVHNYEIVQGLCESLPIETELETRGNGPIINVVAAYTSDDPVILERLRGYTIWNSTPSYNTVRALLPETHEFSDKSLGRHADVRYIKPLLIAGFDLVEGSALCFDPTDQSLYKVKLTGVTKAQCHVSNHTDRNRARAKLSENGGKTINRHLSQRLKLSTQDFTAQEIRAMRNPVDGRFHYAPPIRELPRTGVYDYVEPIDPLAAPLLPRDFEKVTSLTNTDWVHYNVDDYLNHLAVLFGKEKAYRTLLNSPIRTLGAAATAGADVTPDLPE